jgi:Ser/Thr protein kinase RdoA (MazF antagonist)
LQPFDRLTPRGQVGRLRALARVALEHYDDHDESGDRGEPRVSLLKQTFNTMFRVVDHRGHKTALRVGARDRIHPPETEAVETAWLTALRAESEVVAPLPIANRSGSFMTTVADPAVPEARTCVRFEWARGRRLGETMNATLTRDLGRLAAQLHAHGAAFEGGCGQPILVGNRALGFMLRDLIPRDDPEYGTLLAEALDRCQASIDALWAHPPHPPHILHGDLHRNNVLVWRGRLTPVDFQDLLWGFEIQDVSITVSSFDSYPDPDALAAAFRAGYAELRPWPADDAILLGTLVAARHLSVLNLGYNLRRPGFEGFRAAHARWVRDWMRSSS